MPLSHSSIPSPGQHSDPRGALNPSVALEHLNLAPRSPLLPTLGLKNPSHSLLPDPGSAPSSRHTLSVGQHLVPSFLLSMTMISKHSLIPRTHSDPSSLPNMMISSPSLSPKTRSGPSSFPVLSPSPPLHPSLINHSQSQIPDHSQLSDPGSPPGQPSDPSSLPSLSPRFPSRSPSSSLGERQKKTKTKTKTKTKM